MTAPADRDRLQADGPQEAARAVTLLSLPDIHCAGCIATVEGALCGLDGVHRARVNLTLKRAEVEADPELPPEALVSAVEAAGHKAQILDGAALGGDETDRAARDLLMRLGLAGFAAMNVMLLSVAVWSGAEAATRDLFHWISGAIALPVVAISGKPFFASAARALGAGRVNMDVPIAIALVLAAGLSLFETARGGEEAYFDAALSLMFFLLAGRYLDMRMRGAARSAARTLAAIEPHVATRKLADGRTFRQKVAELAMGDVIVVAPGERVPADGRILRGETELDLGVLTGETAPVAAGPGEAVPAGAIVQSAPVEIEVTAAAADSSLARMARAVAAAEAGRAKYTALAERAARIYAPVVHGLAALAGAGWFWATGDLHFAVTTAIAVLIITCPCALGLAVPAVSTAATGRLLSRGLLVKSETALERLAEIDHVVFDKTGTLTEGRLALASPLPQDREIAAVARTLAEASAHPVSRALAQALAEAGVPCALLSDLREQRGDGVHGRWQGRSVRLGRPRSAARAGRGAGGGAAGPEAVLEIDGAEVARFAFADRLRDGAAELVAALKARGLWVTLLSGDAEGPVRAVAEALGIEDWQAGCRPEAKLARIQAVQAAGHRVLMIGDGLNDTAPLAAAHASIAPASALDAARTAADLVLLSADLSRIAEALAVAVKARRLIVQNFALSALYNAVAIPLAVAGWASPLMAALAMSASSVTVSLNGARARLGRLEARR